MGNESFHERLRTALVADGVNASNGYFELASAYPIRKQGNDCPHGLHDLFYWQRSRGSGIYVTRNGTGLVVSLRSDVNHLTIIRPYGDLDGIVSLVKQIVPYLRHLWSGSIALRYCSDALVTRMRLWGWDNLGNEWSSVARSDDETYPQIILPLMPINSASGAAYRMIRQACKLHNESYYYKVDAKILDVGEEEFCLHNIPNGISLNNVALYEYYDYVKCTFRAVKMFAPTGLLYHYLLGHDGRLFAFAITGSVGTISDGYLLIVAKVKRLARTYLKNNSLTIS